MGDGTDEQVLDEFFKAVTPTIEDMVTQAVQQGQRLVGLYRVVCSRCGKDAEVCPQRQVDLDVWLASSLKGSSPSPNWPGRLCSWCARPRPCRDMRAA
jgi:hypothetical protein